MTARNVQPEPDAAADPSQVEGEHSEAPAEHFHETPLETLRRTQANRVAPPGTQQSFSGRTRGSNPSAPRSYNRHR
jgi:hypothetical protein